MTHVVPNLEGTATSKTRSLSFDDIQNIERNMAKREQCETAVVCPNCKKIGTVRWEENKNSFRHRAELGTTLKSVSSGFRVGKGTEIFCTTCNIRVQT
jgi:hypothetical protein